MHTRTTYIFAFILTALSSLFFSSCAEEEIVRNDGSSSLIQIVGRVPGFTEYDVATRAAKNQAESAIKNMTLLIFDNAGELINEQHVESAVPLFVIDRNDLKKADDNGSGITAATIYLIANVSRAVIDTWGIGDISDLEIAVTNVTSIDIPTNGFPMIGNTTGVNLDPNGTVTDGKIELNVENLYAKIVFSLQVNTTQNTGLYTPNFQMTSWEVHNLPKGVSLSKTLDDGQTVYYNNTHSSPIISRRFTGSNPVSGSNTLEFSFYMPEHKVNPGISGDSYSYPSGIKDNDKQRYKPCLVEDIANYDGKPTYVIINGIFTDHQNHTKQISYKVYLGEDNWQDFNITRNCQYNNYITILGTTNSKDALEGSVSVDHRVTISQNDINVSMERETMLDSHIEVRPVQIKIPQKDGVDQSVKVYLASPTDPNTPIKKNNNDYNWARFEVVEGAMNTEEYCDPATQNKGRRKYFTTDLLTTLNNNNAKGNGIQATLSKEENAIWIYFDENTNVSEDGVRRILLVVEYYEDNVPVSQKQYIFQQHDLFPVIYTDTEAGIEYRYDIEFYEEYLHHFNSDDDHSVTRAGMPWGPKEIISDEIMAIQDVQNGWTDYLTYIEDAIKRAGGYYDFQNNFWGRKYTEKLIAKMNQGVLTQDAIPNSAAQHCHNKNKRNSDGEVVTTQWYLPAIGEIQHIMSAAYTDFDMFQDNLYWSSQTSYRIGHFKYNLLWGFLGSVEGDYFYEDKEWARATKAVYEGNNVYTYLASEVTGISKTWTGSVTNQTGNFTTEVAPTSRDDGNQERDQILRVRAVRNKYKRNIGQSNWEEITVEE